VFILAVALAVLTGVQTRSPTLPIVIMLAGFVLMQSPRVAKQWERGVVLRLGRFVGLRGPGAVLDRPSSTRCRPGSISGRSPPGSPPSRR
jgi:hypothetical protein